MATTSDLSDRLPRAIQAAGITQGKLAELIGASQPAVSQWCTGKKIPSEENYPSLAGALGVNVDWLRTGSGRMKAVDESADRLAYQQQATWGFRAAPKDGGRDYGNANVWSFDPSLEVLVREVLQNALDASLPSTGPVKVVFRLIQLRDDDLKDYFEALKWAELREHLEASTTSGQKLGTLIKDGLGELDATGELVLLVIEDSGTTGLLGPEKGEGQFAALCRNNLDSSKEEAGTKGGAFGLGKAVLWRASRFATVTFCSNLARPTEEGFSHLRLLGRCDLPWHGCETKHYAGSGWLGRRSPDDDEDAISFWENETLANNLYLDRRDIGSGTSACVVGFHDASADQPRSMRELADELEKAAARHFFPALVLGDLTVTIETYEGRKGYLERRATSAVRVRAEDLQPENCQLVQALRDGTVTKQLENSGDVASCRITLEVPKRKGERSPSEYKHEAVLLVRQLGEEQATAKPNEVAMFRGPGMVIEYRNLAGICMGARPFHAALLCGKAPGKAGDPEARDANADHAAEEFLRTAEPPAHNKWTATPELKTVYARGCKTRLDEFLSQVKEAVRNLVRPVTRDLGDGPLALRELFRLGNEPVPQERPRIVEQHANPPVPDEQGRWHVEARIRLKARVRSLSIEPAVLFLAETGGGQAVRWEKMEAITGCSVRDGQLLVPPKTREVRFRGVTDPRSHPVPAKESCIVVDLIRVGEPSGAAS
ncbi:MAG: helix-turn-helix transcriptional regulator [Candidatus Omnitrophica bacterium]|nr:helix-turn-helix transcriptional regulator [Candidatus Omnitrophota bacterium]